MKISVVAIAYCILASVRTQLAFACNEADTYDFIVVGSGPGGCVFARRAAECGHSVLLLERGNYGADGPFDVGDPTNIYTTADTRIPKMFATAVTGGFAGSEGIPSATNPYLGGAATLAFQGNMIGGASNMNGMLWARPDLEKEITTLNEWPANWNAGKISQAFSRVEVQTSKNSFETLFSRNIHQVAVSQGFTGSNLNRDGENVEVLQYSEITRKNGQRHDAFSAYINDADPSIKDRITVITEYNVQRVDVEEYDIGGGETRLRAKSVDGGRFCANEGVVLAAGAIKSPKILEDSGIGGLGLVENNQVGENLQDHLNHLVAYAHDFTFAPNTYEFDFPVVAEQAGLHQTSQTGLFADSFARMILFSKELGSTLHNFQAHLLEGLPFFAQQDGTSQVGWSFNAIGFAALALDIKSKGWVHGDTFNANWGSDPTELGVMAAGIQRIRQILSAVTAQTGILFFEIDPATNQPYIDSNTNQPTPVQHMQQDSIPELIATLAQVVQAARAPVCSSFHFTGSLSLGKVVDPHTIEVFGDYDVTKPDGSIVKEKQNIKGLHVVDASIIPKIPRRNPMALTYAVAEHASSNILKCGVEAMGDPHFKASLGR